MCREAFKKFKACIKVPDINTHRSNPEKDRVTIEHTCEALPKLVQEIDGEEHRAVREGLDEESLAILYLLREPDLKASDGQLVFDAIATHAQHFNEDTARRGEDGVANSGICQR